MPYWAGKMLHMTVCTSACMPLSPLAFSSTTHASHAVVSQWPPLLQETMEDGYYDQQRLVTHPQSMEVTTGGGGTRTGGLILIFKADSCWDLARGNLTHFLDAKGGFFVCFNQT